MFHLTFILITVLKVTVIKNSGHDCLPWPRLFTLVTTVYIGHYCLPWQRLFTLATTAYPSHGRGRLLHKPLSWVGPHCNAPLPMRGVALFSMPINELNDQLPRTTESLHYSVLIQQTNRRLSALHYSILIQHTNRRLRPIHYSVLIQ